MEFVSAKRKFRAWSDSILKISYSRGGDDEAGEVMKEFADVTEPDE